ncbi:hypothetical protein ACIGO6_34045 [Streptomyces sp. NPDC053750]|uniref:hypothetical protein n=1 Tax=Streptomyces sp. NPDC053750 TaxID=3365714 RepID=UPI0037D9212C
MNPCNPQVRSGPNPSVQVLEAMRNLGITGSKDDAQGFMGVWHYVNHHRRDPH